jgi:hypothetical protein
MKGIRRALPDVITAVLNTLPERERDALVLYLYRGATISDLSERFQVPPHRVRGIISTAMSKIRHPSRALLLRDIAGDGGYELAASELLRMVDISLTTGFRRLSECAQCGAGIDLVFYGSPGRPRRYCSAACRQAAYRARRRDGSERSGR